MQTAAAWRTEAIASGRLTRGTLAGFYRSLWRDLVLRLIAQWSNWPQPSALTVDERQEDLRRQRKRTAASTNCVLQAAPPQKILWSYGQQRTKYLQCGKLKLMGIVGPVDNSVSRDSDRFLAVGAVTQSDRLEIELVQRPDTPAAILIKWPPQPTVTDPAKLTATIAAIVRVLGMAQIELAARRASGKFKRRRQTHEVVLRRS